MIRDSHTLRQGTAVREVHIEQLKQDLVDLHGYGRALVIFRLRGAVVGQSLLPVEDGRITLGFLRACLPAMAWPIWQRLMTEDAHPRDSLPKASIVVCTRDRTTDLACCLKTLSPLAAQGHEVIVVDSAPSDDGTTRLISRYPAIRYLREPRPGLDVARNRGLQAATGEIVAFTDDDAQVDGGWLLALLRHFDDPMVAIVTGITLPLELETSAQEWFEWTNGFGRGFVQKDFDAANLSPTSAGRVGGGVNMAIRRSAIEQIGLFDEALDSGTPTLSGGDQEFFYRTLARGYRIVYEPAAVAWHRHRRDWNALCRTVYGYGVGVFAWWTRTLLVERELTLLKWAPKWFFEHHVRNLVRSLLKRPNHVPFDLAFAEIWGSLAGPSFYLRSRRMLRKQRSTPIEVRILGPTTNHKPALRPDQTHPSVAEQARYAPDEPPVLSIIIPTHNRCDQLMRSLEALSRQSWPPNAFEVLVVADACHDNTAAKVRAYALHAPYRLSLLTHSAKNAAATRNLGAANARGIFLLFLDDDVVPQPGLVRAHMEARHHEDAVVFGYSKPILPKKASWWQQDARRWWEDTFRAMAEAGHRFNYRDFFSGNLSMPAVLFHEVGGFDTSFRGRLEDYEFGLRLLKRGATFQYVPDAIGYHYETADLALWLHRIRQEGFGDVQIGQRHPEVRTSLFANFDQPRGRWWRARRMIRKSAFAYPHRGDWLERLLLIQGALCEQLRMRGSWRKIVGVLREYNYWRGVGATIGGWRALADWLQEAPMPPVVTINAPVIDILSLPPADVLTELLEQATERGLRLTLDGVEVLTISPQPGAEPLRKEHLQSAWRKLAEQQFVPALALRLIRSVMGEISSCLSNLPRSTF